VSAASIHVSVAFVPRDLVAPERHVCIVLDVLRASSTLVTLLAHGAEPIYVAGTIDAARTLAARLPDRPLLCGEVGGLPPPDFDHGNSPTELARLALNGRPAVLATSNGTRALAALAPAPAVLVGCFLNAAAVVTHAWRLARAHGVDLALVCAGDDGGTTFSLEDTLAAGCLVARVHRAQDDDEAAALDATASAAWWLFHAYAARGAPEQAAARGFADAPHGRELETLGFQDDLAYCARIDATSVVPMLDRVDDALAVRHARHD
jgi:2-phosphosulfolactate phosphatase